MWKHGGVVVSVTAGGVHEFSLSACVAHDRLITEQDRNKEAFRLF